jgi:hypothetical protein
MTTTTKQRITFSFGATDMVMDDLRELQSNDDYGLSSLTLQEILKLAVSKLKSFEKRRVSSADIETAYINSVPGWADKILSPFKPAPENEVLALEKKLGIKLT